MAEIFKEQDKDDLEDKIQIFSNTDEKLKSLGKILNNDSSRKILQLLIEKEMTANEIATQTKLSLPLALYHVNQMIESEIVIISKTSTNSKNQPMKYYSAKSGIIILPKEAVGRAKKSKILSNSMKRILRLSSIGIISIIAGIITEIQTAPEKFPDSTYPVPISTTDSHLSVTISTCVVLIGIIIEIIFIRKNRNTKKKKENY